MAVIRFEKVVGSLPATIQPNTVYAVRTGSGFDLYITDATGGIAHTLNSSGAGGSFLGELFSYPFQILQDMTIPAGNVVFYPGVEVDPNATLTVDGMLVDLL